MNEYDIFLNLIKDNGTENVLKSIEIEKIPNIDIKIICRTIMYSIEELTKKLIEYSIEEKEKAKTE